MSIIVGIDPGLPLTLGVLKAGVPHGIAEGEAVAVQLVKPGRKSGTWRNNPALVVAFLRTTQPDLVMIEQVGMRPDQDVGSGQDFVGSMHLCVGICAALGLRYRLVAPSVWKPAMSIKVTRQNPKEPARLRALETWPDSAAMFARKKDHNRAEALLLAEYGRLNHV